ncbi:fibronectin type III domain-containing protein [Mucilaginibacter psychrotolerans]|uniref:Fibronectin type-III domain-containing protein n=1 Tax=Mucilaginibacter psychrotolerans TaxID=1524096 RepID=A0A4Y8SCL2_9SPHI|nr:hypothetical protein [Mucilaginibacter psychrotolerans]TFF36853.1 hypothetical protein E2R66_13880 [Mucilaginibacter psychrotolerans]
MKRLIYTATIFGILLAGCGKGKKGDNPAPPDPKPPVAAELVFPEQNSTCISGDIISIAQSTVTLKWKAALNADSYAVIIKNLLTGDTQTLSSSSAQISVTLQRNTPFSWLVRSKSNALAATADSETWKFYNSGDGVRAYAPFPVDEMLPATGTFVSVTGNKVTLSWQGSDTDNDITGYDVYFGTTETPGLFKSNLTAAVLNDIALSTGIRYYWKVVTHDSKGNTSTSEVADFTTK